MNYFLSFAFCAFSSFFFSQNFAYSFQGKLSIEQQNILQKEILDIHLISNCELKYKTDSERGEIIFFVLKNESRSESSEEFSPVEIKSLLIKQQLEPLEFRMIK
jgi:hypothetical protein